ncbi:glycoside hydrolase family 19 protein [Stenotrophomonas sp. MMGLT7]|uniref:glycoside hydrolase family 19 protein n=1 Tax=Stenotrophomonas sp. MMGLT7 TaxID=2901227 RepID=UPI001E4C6478|nr:glycoside hydrolase family 19 protein [Stenotrophomonas sp. MMGLT7]MCD7096990.1 glycoside hydrolase family 19 protein [Stenotrophomonas sp. MMGLT7]
MPAPLTAALLAAIMQCPDSRARYWLPHLVAAMQEFGIASVRRQAHFLATIGHESLGLAKVEESLFYRLPRLLEVFGRRIPASIAPKYACNPQALACRVYAGRGGNGDEASGDGWKFRGRSPGQITHRGNYRRVGELLGLPLEDDPDLLLQPAHGARASAAFWKDNGFNPLADDNNTVGVAKKWNLGSATSKARPEGLEDRISRTERALKLLGV